MGIMDKLRTHLTPDGKKFARMLMEHFKAANPGVAVHFDEEKFCIFLRAPINPKRNIFLVRCTPIIAVPSPRIDPV